MTTLTLNFIFGFFKLLFHSPLRKKMILSYKMRLIIHFNQPVKHFLHGLKDFRIDMISGVLK